MNFHGMTRLPKPDEPSGEPESPMMRVLESSSLGGGPVTASVTSLKKTSCVIKSSHWVLISATTHQTSVFVTL